MKNLLKKAVIFAVAGIMALSVEAQEEKGVQFTVSGDFVSSYVWRGIYQGAQACVQPTLGLGLGGFSLTWPTLLAVISCTSRTSASPITLPKSSNISVWP